MTTATASDHRYEIETRMSADEALAAVERAAELWGAQWARQGNAGRLTLPVNSGVRTGLLSGRLEARSRSNSTLLAIDIEERQYEINRQAVALLVAGGIGGVVLMLWPFFPVLLGLAPVAIVMALITWFVVGSRIRYNGPREFLDFVLEQARLDPGELEETADGSSSS